MADQRICRTVTGDFEPVGPGDSRSAEFLKSVLERELGPDHAALFAEPQTAANGKSLDWLTDRMGTVRAYNDLSEDEKAVLRSKLNARVSDIRDLVDRMNGSDGANERRAAAALSHALDVPDQGCVFRVGDEPVLVNWGYRRSGDRNTKGTLARFMAEGGTQDPVSEAPAVDPPPANGRGRSAPVRFRPGEGGTVVGRDPSSSDCVIYHPGIAARHARYIRKGSDLFVEDLGSGSGTYVNGRRVLRRTKVDSGDRVDIGPYRMDVAGEDVVAVDAAHESSLRLDGVSRQVRVAGRSSPLVILDDVSLEIGAGEFVCIIGPSGSGKSTLMDAMSGRVTPTGGTITFNGMDLHRNFEHLKSVIAMVPQHNVLHEALTLRQALTFTAKLRLPSDTSRKERTRIVEEAAASVGLSERLDTKIGRLSGGQKKRCSLASELLDRPALLFLDEVTSGLDEETDQEVMSLLRRMADDGMTIVCVTHTLANIEPYADKLIVMNVGGVPAFYGPPGDALPYFGAHRMGEIFPRLAGESAAVWRARFDEQQAAVSGAQSSQQAARAETTPAKPPFKPLKSLATTLRQTAVLTHRNILLLASDSRLWGMALVQALLIGALIGYAFTDFGPDATLVNSKIAMLLLIGLAGLWIGCNSSAKEIVGDLPIFQREYDVNLSSVAFVLSKLLVASAFTMAQMGLVYALAVGLSKEIPGDDLYQFGFSLAAAFAGCAMGLLISAATNTTEQATTVVPLVLVPQLILSGVIVPSLPDIAQAASEVAMTSYVLIEAMKSVYFEIDGPVMGIDADTGQPIELTAQSYWIGARMIAIHCAVMLLSAFAIVRLRQRARTKKRG